MAFEVLDDLELRLSELGLPESHSDPWHILRRVRQSEI